jgi:hypothetical protein
LRGRQHSRTLALQATGSWGVVTRMLSGFNTNVRHRGVLFHVQTEDSGRAHPHVITHLYYGGTILASEKSSYRKLVDEADLPGKVRSLMEGQHAAMLARLRAGELDDVLSERLGPDVLAGARQVEGAGTTQVGGAGITQPSEAGEAPAGAARARRAQASADGPDRPLDELILDYLVETTRRARRRRTEGAGASREPE